MFGAAKAAVSWAFRRARLSSAPLTRSITCLVLVPVFFLSRGSAIGLTLMELRSRGRGEVRPEKEGVCPGELWFGELEPGSFVLPVEYTSPRPARKLEGEERPRVSSEDC